MPHDGGAFYSNESVEGVRPYYRSAWPPLLYAAALWLSSGGFDKAKEMDNEEIDTTNSSGLSQSNSTPAKTPESINNERLYLLLGEWCNVPIFYFFSITLQDLIIFNNYVQYRTKLYSSVTIPYTWKYKFISRYTFYDSMKY